MANIIINVNAFECQTPIVNSVTRSGETYTFNWTSLGDLYENYGMNVDIKLYYTGDSQPEQEYTSSAIPFNTTDFVVTNSFDTTSFRLEFSIDNGSTCYYSINIPYYSVIIV